MTSRKIILIVAAITIGGMALMGKKVLDNQVFAPTCAAKEVAIPVNPRQIAESITVKVFSANGGGSGTLIDKKGQVYTVLTNQHVLTPGEPYRIQTPDGVVYSANAITNVNFGKNDLALLQFRADADYAVAVLAALETRFLQETGFLGNLAVNEEVFAAGFPFDSTPPLTKGGQGGISFNSGKISLLPDKSLKDGYRIGYTNDIQKGMSGGPILNTQGQVIGINGVHAYPLFGDPYVFEDGSKPSDVQKEQMTRLSWGVPIQIVVQTLPQLAATNLVKNVERIAQEITVLITYPNGNGSGVIIAQRDNTYYVLTANHVVRDETQYEVTTPDGRCYPVNYRTVKKFEGVDLAVLEFKSDRSYRVATLGNYDLGTEDRVAFVSGWPGSRKGSREEWNRLFTPGAIFPKGSGFVLAKEYDSLTNGYELVYTNITAGGMSGGAVLDTRGRVIGIHGRADGEIIQDEAGKISALQLGYSLGVPISTFLSLALQVGLEQNLTVETTAPPPLTEQEGHPIRDSLLPIKEIPTTKASATDWLNYGNQLWRIFNFKEAIAAFDKAIQLKPDFYQAWYGRGMALIFAEQHQKAIESFNMATKIEPKFAPAWRWKSFTIFSFLKRNQDAVASIEKGLEFSPNNLSLLMWQGQLLTQLKRYSEARDTYSRFIEIKPDSIAYGNRGGIRLLLKDYPAALADLNKAIRLNPDLAKAYAVRGAVYAEQKDYQEALADYNQAIRLNPEIDLAQGDLAEGYLGRGIIRVSIGDNYGAIADLNEAIRLNPDSPEAYLWRANAYANVRNFFPAFKDCNEAIRLKPDLAQAYTYRGQLLFLIGGKQGAIADIQKAAQLFQQQGDIANYQKVQQFLKQLQK